MISLYGFKLWLYLFRVKVFIVVCIRIDLVTRPEKELIGIVMWIFNLLFSYILDHLLGSQKPALR